MSIVLEEITKLYGEQKALDSISFEVNPGDILGFLGPNGAGKSTTMKILTGYIVQNGGRARVCNYDINKDSLSVRKHLGYLPELNPLYTDMYVKEYLLFAAEVHGLGKKADLRAEEMIDRVGLAPERKKKIGQLSKGYKQRVGLAQAMIHNPEVLILDEPTSGLDPNQVIEIRELIREIGENKTVLFSTHIMQEVEAMCNRVVIINKGKIVADDKTEVLNRKLQSEINITVEFKEPVEESGLKEIKGVMSVQKKGKLYILKCNEDIRGQLSARAADKGWTLLAMNREENSLEEIFQKLTK